LSQDRPAGILISVITPSYNRSHTLEDAYRSLLDQQVRLEWIVADDGSTDQTPDLIEKLTMDAPFPIRYLQQDHAGKHAAVNRGVAAASGELIGLLDSDDMLTPGALRRLVTHWRAIPDRSGYVGVTGLCVDEQDRVVGDRFAAEVVDASWQQMCYMHRVRGEKWGVQRADVLRAYPFPEGAFVPEGIVWREIGKSYQTRYVNEVVRVYRTGGADRITFTPFSDRAFGATEYGIRMLNDDIGWFRHNPAGFARAGVQFARGLFHQRVPVHLQAARLSTWRARALWAAALPLGWLLYLGDCRSARS
jgi:glycosyltransferase involved in cell wall biosynthesis